MGVLKNEVPSWIALFVWAGIQVGLFGYYFYYLYGSKVCLYSEDSGIWISVCSSSGELFEFQLYADIITVCRNLLSFTRRYLCKCCLRSLRRLLDENISFHKLSAYAICFWTTIHTVAHCYNVEQYVAAQSSNTGFSVGNVSAYQLSSLGTGQCPVSAKATNWVNPICDRNSHSVLEAFKIFPAVSGIIITLTLIVIVFSATEFIRRSYFEIFWFTHHIFVIFFAFVLVHGLRGVVRSQDASHDVSYCGDKFSDWGRVENGVLVEPKCPLPEFQSNTPSTYFWIIGPIVLYIIERLIRFARSFQKVTISKAVKHPSKVIELQMQKDGFSMEAGQYIFIKCPSISRTEWHPFTLTSSPEEDYFSVHIRIVGDWTEALAKAVGADEQEFQDPSKMPLLAVDGPFGTASEDWDQYEVDILVGAGIGVTPFASIMKHMWYTYIQSKENNVGNCKLKKVYFYWICPDTNAFEWFSDLLGHLEDQMDEKNCADFLTHKIFLTRGWDTNFARNVALHEEEEVDVVTGLQQKTNYGRPNWDQIFSKTSEDHPKTSIGVFFCGPAVLSDTLHAMSNKHSSADGAKFVYNKENF
ncbi:NOX3 [Bugula neritina]|uniref:NOX3 n=1 Tax=Bugula neritina TaxID=10212 RepID=A0A7J7IYX9_BUGNE|nr:NOX3 [Bugula neritina]